MIYAGPETGDLGSSLVLPLTLDNSLVPSRQACVLTCKMSPSSKRAPKAPFFNFIKDGLI